MQVIGITGRKRHGKDSVARELVLNGFKIVRFADPLKAMLRAFYQAHDLVPSEIERRLEGDLKEHPCIYLNGKTPRHAMQTLGTEWGRDLIDQDLWTDSLRRRASLHDKVVVPDVRFENECAKIHEMEGKVVRVDASQRVPEDTFSNHSSETGIGKLPADLEIDNNGTPFELQHAVKAVLGFSV
ncbi:hypothetical protein [Bradyrhizobium stylosanthis]|uniref:Dephospho-CoA kinase n=1 Tax=Bradyrhizobium stylosanthis TaxID=1803665 RepID=A0A560CXG3_9BRAD|nr:hypothetical protein [Bradyrhizobium stylosanthis]TWA89549.1 hypothetical protein FBZ96_11917 [Bradyrhizobium stylosanthis]